MLIASKSCYLILVRREIKRSTSRKLSWYGTHLVVSCDKNKNLQNCRSKIRTKIPIKILTFLFLAAVMLRSLQNQTELDSQFMSGLCYLIYLTYTTFNLSLRQQESWKHLSSLSLHVTKQFSYIQWLFRFLMNFSSYFVFVLN